MRVIYNLTIYLYLIAIRIFALFDKKAKLWIKGRKNQTVPSLKDKKVIWMHCSSLGEFEQGRPVLEKLRSLKKDHIFVLTFFSPSGYEKIKNSNIADYILYLPIDLPSYTEEFVKKINPELAIFVKYDFWYNYLRTLNKKKIETIFISVLLDKDHRLLKSYNRILINELKKIKYIFTQDEETLELLKKNGFKNAVKAGDTRIERVLEIAGSDFSDKIIEKFVSKDKKTLICGSTWKKDIEVIAASQDFLLPGFKMIIAPHEITKGQIDYIVKSFKNKKIAFYSKNKDEEIKDADILIVDTIGILSKIYRYADLVFIGGGFGTGIHNTLEPAAYFVPVIFGTKYHRFYEAEKLVERKAFFSVKNTSELREIVLSLESNEFLNTAKNNIIAFFDENKGATKIIIDHLEKSN